MAYKAKSKAAKLPKGYKEDKSVVSPLPKVRGPVGDKSYVGKKK